MELSSNPVSKKMMYQLIFATNNANKVREVQSMLDQSWKLITLKEAGIVVDIPEPYDTLEENAGAKSAFIYQSTKKNCFSEDTGLEVYALNNAPGIRSARFAGEHGNDAANIQKLLHLLDGNSMRNARFRTVISLLLEGDEYQFEGICTGTISLSPRGENGFGYDPVFIPDGSHQTFAEMDITSKNIFSHRKKAVAKLLHFLSTYHGQSKN